ncbi:metallophosphoesterase [Peribacillus glennii]|uniref:Metallophosphoesterase n=1 Tax=Peribacillus glennii TaxID=2303991 RepID=A0A372LIV7_9BACI|nr:metallophosphoesterase [Peribacillus glennii]RFU65566.1 metallophosphoesterase [Peribacillus glennii]
MAVIYIIIAVSLIGMIFFMVKTAYLDKVVENDLAFEEFPATFGTLSIFFISDIHRRVISDEIINRVNGRTDIVIIGGDLKEGGVPLTRVEKNLAKLKKVGPVYFVWGNNDYEGDYHMLDATLLRHGVKILDNGLVTFESEQGEKIELLGIDDIAMERDRLDLALADSERQAFKILVSHNPLVMQQIKKENKISLVLSGHTHGGQIRFMGIGPYKLGGMRKQGGTVILTSNGYGTTSLPLRLGAEPETHLLHLKKQPASSK